MNLLNKLDVIAPFALLFAVAGILVFSMPTHEKLTQRQKLLAGATLGKEVVQRVKAYRDYHGSWPMSLVDLDLPPKEKLGDFVDGLTLGNEGRVEVALKGDDAFVGKSFIFDFVDRGGRMVWRCSAPGLPNEWLPDMCVSEE